jgi:acetyl/propionyl-CoA carboxylase alpha subunit
MEIRLRLADRPVTVQLTRRDDAWDATVGDASHRVACVHGPLAAAAGGATVEELALEVDGQPFRVLVARTRDRVLVGMGGRVFTFETGEETRAVGAGGARSGRVEAPMPGKVVSVLVAPGATVEVGQPVVVLEAMKMETTLTAEVAGTVASVPAQAGAVVGAGELLVEITPSET